jgi:adenosine deaminase
MNADHARRNGGPSPEVLRALPKVELHRHLDGSVRIETIWEIAQEKGQRLDARSPEELSKRATIRSPLKDLSAVLACFRTQQRALCSFAAISRVTFENIEDAWRDGVKLLELRFAPSYIAEGKTISNDEIIAAVLDGLCRGMARYPIEVGLIGIIPRSLPTESGSQATRDLIRWKKSGGAGADRICGFDLADRETDFAPELFAPFVEQAREAGMGITIHSGEESSAAHVARTLEMFRPSRIGHGIRAWGDGEVMRRLKDQDVLLEICPTSNWLTSSVPSLEAHPLPSLYREGVPVCINSDDPNVMSIDLVNEYRICRDLFGFANEDFAAMNRAALGHSFLPAAVRERVRDEHFPAAAVC